MNEKRVQAEDIKIEDLLFRYKFIVPAYQRPYVWAKDEVQDLWNDLRDETGRRIFFLGTFVFIEQPDTHRYEVIDGQQRLITLTILLAAIRDVIFEYGLDAVGDADLSQLVQNNFIRANSASVTTNDRGFKIEFYKNTELRDYFSKNIQQHNREERKKILDLAIGGKAQQKLYSNYQFFYDKIKEEINPHKNEAKVELLKKIVDTLGKLQVVMIRLRTDEDAYTLFETVNARGAQLEIADLVKNLIYKKANLPDEQKISLWENIESNVGATKQDLTRRFLRGYWLSKKGFVLQKDLYRTLKLETNYKALLVDLEANSKNFNRLLLGNPEDFEELNGGVAIHQSLTNVRILKVWQCYVLFLSVLQNSEIVGEYALKTFRLIENFSFIYSTIAKEQSNRLEDVYSKYAVELYSIKKVKESAQRAHINGWFDRLHNELKDILPSREIFVERFKKFEYKSSNGPLVKYILTKFNNDLGTGEVVLNPAQVNIEHILPRNPSRAWGLGTAQIKDYVNLLGNLTIIKESFNREAGNKGIAAKNEIFSNSDVKLTKQIARTIKDNNYKWDQEAIQLRQMEMAELAYDTIWSCS